MINRYPHVTRGQCPITEEPALQALLACEQRFANPLVLRRGVRSGVVCNGMRNGGDNQRVGLANPHPQSIVNGTIGDLEGARPTIIRPPVIPANLPPKSDQNQPVNPFSWSANGIAKSTAKTGGQLLAETVAVGRRAAVRPQPATGAAPAPGA